MGAALVAVRASLSWLSPCARSGLSPDTRTRLTSVSVAGALSLPQQVSQSATWCSIAANPPGGSLPRPNAANCSRSGCVRFRLFMVLYSRTPGRRQRPWLLPQEKCMGTLILSQKNKKCSVDFLSTFFLAFFAPLREIRRSSRKGAKNAKKTQRIKMSVDQARALWPEAAEYTRLGDEHGVERQAEFGRHRLRRGAVHHLPAECLPGGRRELGLDQFQQPADDVLVVLLVPELA